MGYVADNHGNKVLTDVGRANAIAFGNGFPDWPDDDDEHDHDHADHDH